MAGSAGANDLTIQESNPPCTRSQELFNLWETTPASIARQAMATRFPRYLSDYLVLRCGKYAATHAIAVGDEAPTPVSIAAHEESRQLERCIAFEFERQRLATFAEICMPDRDPQRLLADVPRSIERIVGK